MQQICDDNTLKANYTYGERDFSRQRILCFKTTVLLLLNALKRSLSIELHEFFENIPKKVSCSKQAFSKQRRKLKPEFFHDWNAVLVDSFYRHYKEEYRRWKGLRVWAIRSDIMQIIIVHGQVWSKKLRSLSLYNVLVLFLSSLK